MVQHAIRFFAADGARRAIGSYGPFLRDLLDILVDACQQATRLRLEGRSIARGIVPTWLEQAAAFEVLNIHESEVVLGADPLGKTLSWKLWQRQTTAELDPSRSCLDLMAESLEDALNGRTESDRYDRHLIATLETFGRLSRYGVDRLDVINGRTLHVDKPALEVVKQLRAQTPEDRRVIVTGKLETIRHSDRAFILLLDSGEALPGIAAESVDPSALAALFGKNALVSGVAKFRPSGKVLLVEAERIDLAIGDVSVWAHAPKPFSSPIEQPRPRPPQGQNWGFDAIFGQLQTEESDEEFMAALADLS